MRATPQAPSASSLVSPVSDEKPLMPTTAADKGKPGNREENAPSPAGERKPTLLVVEDDENISTAISEYFSRAGYVVKTAGDGLAGVQSALNDHPDAIVL